MGCTLPLDQQIRLMKWEACQMKKYSSSATIDMYMQLEAGINPLVNLGGTTITLLYSIRADSLRVMLDGTPLLRDRTDRVSYTTPIYGNSSLVLYFNQPFMPMQIYVIEFTYYTT